VQQKYLSVWGIGCHTWLWLQYSKFGIFRVCVYRHVSDVLSALLLFWYVWILFWTCSDGMLSSERLPPVGLSNKPCSCALENYIELFMQHNKVTGSEWREVSTVWGLIHVEFMVYKVTLWQVYLHILRFFPISIIPPMLHSHSSTTSAV
jgi:hypothetical protein